MIAFYYALSGLACAIYYRRELVEVGEELALHRRRAARRSRDPVLPLRQVGHRPLRSRELVHGRAWLGVGPPLVIGVGFLLLGVVLSCSWRLAGHTSGTSAAGRSRPSTRMLPRAESRWPPRRSDGDIVLGYDDSACAKAALDAAIELARRARRPDRDRLRRRAARSTSVARSGRRTGDALREIGQHAITEALARLARRESTRRPSSSTPSRPTRSSGSPSGARLA